MDSIGFNALAGKTILVTGGAGFIGSHLVDACLALGAEVTVLDNLSSGVATNVDNRATLRIGDVRDRSAVADAVEGIDIVFHQAGHINPVVACTDPVHDCTVNVLGSLNVLDASAAAGVRRVVLASTNLYGDRALAVPRAEHHAVLDEHALLLSPYAASKAALEAYAMVYQSMGRIDTVRLRYANVYGPRQTSISGSGVIAIFCEAGLVDAPLTVFGDGEQTRDFVSVRDVVTANLRAAVETKAAGGVFNVASGVETSVRSLASLVGRLVGPSCDIREGPPRAADFRSGCIDISRSRTVLGWVPKEDLATGLQRYLEWLAESIGTTWSRPRSHAEAG